MTWIMGDSTLYTDIPASVAIAATYATGTYAVPANMVEARFPHAKYGWNRIDVTGQDPTCDTRDWETGDKTGNLEAWVVHHNLDRGPGTAVVYCNRSTIPEVRQLTGTQRLGVDYWLWVATLDGTLYEEPGTVACQFKGAAMTGGHWDASIVFTGTLWTPTALPPLPALLSVAVQAKYADGTTRTWAA